MSMLPERRPPPESEPPAGAGSAFRLIFGRRLKTTELHSEHVGPLQGVPILGLDALGSASYGPEAALTILIPLGASGLLYIRGIMGVIVLLLAILFLSYRQTIAAYPNGGGSYTVARENLGRTAGLVAAVSLLLDYVLNVAVGISAGVGALESALPALQPHTLSACLLLLAVVTIVNLRGVRDSGLAWTLPTYAFCLTLLATLGIGVWKTIESAGHPVPVVAPPVLAAATAPAGIWLILRAFASGCTAMTGVEAVSNGVPIFAQPKVSNARLTLAIICALLGVFLLGVGYLVHAYHIGAMSQEQPAYQSVISQLALAVLGPGPTYYLLIASLLAVLSLSANTSFAGFPRLCRLLAEDSYLPSAFANLGRRLVYTAGISILAGLSAILLLLFGGVTDRLIPLFAVGAFGAFTMSQAGMVVHWRRRGSRWTNPSLLVNAVGALATASALGVIVVTKFSEGAWITVILVPAFVVLFAGVRRHYARIKRETRPPVKLESWKAEPLKVIIPIDGWSRVTERALHFAFRISDDILAIHVTDQETDPELIETWRTRIEEPARKQGLPEPSLKIICSPYRKLFAPLLDYIKSLQREDPGRLIAVIIPELVQPRWWEYLLHNQVAAVLKALLLLNGNEGVIVISTPWYLRGERPARSA